MFHLYLAPFIAVAGPIAGAKTAIVFTAFIIAAAWGFLMKSLKIKNILFALLFMLFCAGYIYPGRLVLCRSFLISIFFMAVILNCVVTKQRIILALSLYLYMLSYVGAWQMAPVILLFDLFSAKFANNRKEALKQMMMPWALAGIAAGFIFSPYFPVNINAVYTQTILILKAQWFGTEKAGTLPMGTELAPVQLKHLICYIGIYGMLVFTLINIFKNQTAKKISSVTAAFLTVTCLYAVMTLFTQKFIEYLAPLFTVTIFLFWEKHPISTWNKSCAVYNQPPPENPTLGNIRKAFAITLLSALGILSVLTLRTSFSKTYPIYQDSAEWIKKNIKKDTLIFSGDWDDNVILFYYLPEYRFLVMLDPYFMYANSADKFLLWKKICEGKMEDPSEIIMDKFGTNIVFVPPDRPGLKHRLILSDNAELVFKGKAGETIFLLYSPHHIKVTNPSFSE